MTAIIVALTMTVLLLFIVLPKKMPLFELIVVWQTSYFIYANLSIIQQLNLKWIRYAESLPDFTLEGLYRYIFVPLLLTWALELVYAKTWPLKLVSMAGVSGVLSMIHWLMHRNDFIHYTEQWNAVYTWIILLLLVIAVEIIRKLFHKIMKTEVLS